MKGVQWELRMLRRYRVLTLYALLTLIYGFGLRILDADLKAWLYPLLLFTDTTVIGIFFVGGLFYFERTEGTLVYRLLTPQSIAEQIAVRAMAFGFVSTLSGVGIALIGGLGARWSLLIPALFLGSSGFTLLGTFFALKYRTISAYFLSTIGYDLLLFSPILAALGWVSESWFVLLPTHWLLDLFRLSVGGESPTFGGLMPAIIYLPSSVFFLWRLLETRYHRLVRRGEVESA